ncbi:hypothetical protein VKT23_019327 [Stygiomarasmius scandens]|uniref:Uncharacterized protein n=1 Tax=Marasmiellus scandens TaxID=2682957 RepID=A0ABR1ILR2_9AGAR
MDTLNLPYRRIITYSRKRPLRLGPKPVCSDNLPQDFDSSPESTLSDDSEPSAEKNESEESEENELEENELENDASKAQDDLRKSLIKALSCPICLELATPPCM